MAKESGKEKYTDPDLRERIKEEIQASDKGGRPDQWSARKSQLLTQEYEKRGGGYTGEKDERQRDLERWTNEEWRTKSVFQNLTVCQAVTLTNRCQTVRHENHRVQLLYNGYRRSWLL